MKDALLPRSLARFNRIVTNPLQGLWAPYLPPYAVIVHRGRTSGREYRTPVLAFRHGGELVVGLPYGAGSDWVRNVLAAGEAGVERLGRLRRLENPRVLDADTPPAELPGVARRLVRYMDVLVADIRRGRHADIRRGRHADIRRG
ncbi:nitroreductase family deazaflavin-dependent oxidoreductase [Actinomadura logoneensis]|uniref:Nitroreductase family deazaflavin-dependent oxidoreductase n=1 Tax=Actinomadura logoneensis TaxID=2293572 RepID=A0A372JJ08_9ACTN|nr:nitroreductase family deazaflavin-dependent oxidoreductase [Actinomadura logoneensis]RFU40001.1 nitroreductase family deazaflavin-dependent oxidoreductase [Actinomadura logoneensis]